MQRSALPHPHLDVRRTVRRWAPALLLLLAIAPPAAAQDEEEDELRRWVPSFALFFDMLGQKAEGAITTGDVMGPPLTLGGCAVTTQTPGGPVTVRNGTLCPDPTSTFPITTPTSSSDTDIAPLVGGSLELMTPRLLAGFLYPRLFAHADVAAAFGFERNLAGERKPGPFFADPLDPSEFDVSEGSVGGQGSRAKIQVRPLVVSAGAGVAFTTHIYNRTLRIKPSFEYLREELDLISSVRRAVKQNDPAQDLDDYRLIALRESDVQTLHGLGGGLEVEADTGRIGPFVLSLYLMGRGYRYTGNLRHTYSDTNEFGETATWHFDIDPWAWRLGVGARFRWLPE